MRAVIWGVGGLGQALLRAAPAYDVAVVALVDQDSAKVGRPLADMPSAAQSGNVLAELPPRKSTGADVVFQSTNSHRETVTRQILAAVEAGYSVVTAAEWMFHPWLRHRDESAAIDAAARKAGVRVVGCGINPGFVFDVLPVLLSHITHSISSIEITRVSNVSGEGPAGFRHLGFGLDRANFGKRVAAGETEGHIGFPESVAAIAERMHLPIDRITDHLEPTLAVRPLQLSHRLINPGEVVGITQTACGYVGGRAALTMRLEMFLDPEGYGRSPQESVVVTGDHSFTLTVKPAARPAEGAAAMMINAAAALPAVPPGLVSLLDLPRGGAPAPRMHAGAPARDERGTELTMAGSRQG
jgi:4-hydroxy-tetrahydrodipicolinate reductase